METTSLIAKLSNGHALGYAVYGAQDPNTATVFYFHGLLSSRLEAAILSQPAAQLGLRIISIDRPGFGLSTFQPNRSVLSFTSDVQELADYLRVPAFSILANTGGAPYALACAKMLLTSRLISVDIMAGQWPLKIKSVWFMKPFQHAIDSGLSKGIGSGLENDWGDLARAADPTPYYQQQEKEMKKRPEVERTTLAGYERIMLWDPAKEAFRVDGKGVGQDLLLQTEYKKWGFEFHEINGNKFRGGIKVWHGAQDELIVPKLAQEAVSQMTGVNFELVSGQGHFGLPVHQGPAILKHIASRMHSGHEVPAH